MREVKTPHAYARRQTYTPIVWCEASNPLPSRPPSVPRESSRPFPFIAQPTAVSQEVQPPFAVSNDQGDEPDVVQFAAPIVYLDEDNGYADVEVIRLGSIKGRVKVRWQTECGSAQTGRRYESGTGELVFEDGEWLQSLRVYAIQDNLWSPTLEFKVVLGEAERCTLGLYLGMCRVKIIDDDPFPSRIDIATSSNFTLFIEYVRLNLSQRGVQWRLVVTVIADQLTNVYLWFTLWANMYMVDVLFNVEDPEASSRLFFRSRKTVAVVLGAMYIAPMFVLHLWEYIKLRMDLYGLSKEFLQESLFRKYLNLSEASRLEVKSADMLVAVMEDTGQVANGFCLLLDAVRVLGKLVVLSYFALRENPGVIWCVFGMPLLMLIVAVTRNPVIVRAAENVGDQEENLLTCVHETCHSYRLISDYSQRPKMNEFFVSRARALKRARIPEKMAVMHNSHFPKWLGACVSGIFVAVKSHEVFSGTLSLGTFLATLSVFREISQDFVGLYDLTMVLSAVAEPLKGLTKYFNLETDLRPKMQALARSLKSTTEARRRLMQLASADGETSFLTDSIHIEFNSVCFHYAASDTGEPHYVFKDVNISCPQGELVAVVGKHGAGRSTLLKILGDVVHATKGHLFIPTHLRTLHVSQEPVLLRMTPWLNLTFGIPNPDDVDPDFVRHVLERLGAMHTIQLIEGEPRRHHHAGRLPPAWSLTQHSMLGDVFSDEDEDDEESSSLNGSDDEIAGTRRDKSVNDDWLDCVTYTERVRIHLARAFLMNPEVMVLHRPLYHFNRKLQSEIMNVFKDFVKHRGIGFDLYGDEKRRRPRTLIFTPEEQSQAREASRIWMLQFMDGQSLPAHVALLDDPQDVSNLTDDFDIDPQKRKKDIQ